MDGSRFPESMDELAVLVMDLLADDVGDAVDDFVIAESRDSPTPWLSLEFTMFEYLPVTFVYDRGVCGFDVTYGNRSISILGPVNGGARSDSHVRDLVSEFVAAARLRVPDKLLASRGWE